MVQDSKYFNLIPTHITGNVTLPHIYILIGVYLALGNQFIANSSQINIRSIGLSSDNPNGALQCITDKKPCCLIQNSGHGEWYLPNGTVIGGNPSATMYYRSRGNYGEVILNHPHNVTSLTGQFCCKVPDTFNINRTLCVILGKLTSPYLFSSIP